ncbi:MAG: ABC transporter transmembrane domain-containing protein, partial [Luteimonas sp.]
MQSNKANVAHSLAWLWSNVFSRRRRLQAALVVIFMLLGAIAEVFTIGAVIPFLAVFADPEALGRTSRFGYVFSSLGIPKSSYSLRTMGLVFCAIAVAAAVIRILLAWFSQRYVFRIGFDIGTALYERMLHQPYTFHIKMNSSRIIASVENIQKLLTKTFIPLMQSCTAVVIGALIMTGLIILSPLLASAAFGAFIVIYSLISFLTRPQLRKNAKIIAKANRSRVQAVQEGLGGIRDVLLENAQKLYVGKFNRIDNKLRRAQGAN